MCVEAENSSVWPSGCRLHHIGAADGRVGAGAVLHDDGTGELVLQLLRDQARERVDAAAGRERHHDAHSALGEFLRRRGRGEGERGGKREQRADHRATTGRAASTGSRTGTPRERRAFLEPRLRRRMAPQRLALRIVERPADRLVVGIDGEIVRGEQLDAVTVGIAHVEEERVGDAVAAGAALHVGEIAAGRHHVAGVQDVERVRIPHADVMQARAAAVGEGEVVRAAAALHPHRPELRIGAFGLGRLGEAEAELGIEVVGGLHVGREAVDVVDALDARALIGGVFLQHRGHAIHPEIEIDRHADRIVEAQRAALERHVRPRHRQLAALEPGGGLVEILFARRP